MPAAACCRSLPPPPVYAKVNPADAPVITLAISSTSLPITTVEDLADTRIAQKISQLVRRRPGQHFRRPAPRRAGAGQSAAAGRLWPQHRRSAHHHLQQQFQRAQGQLRRRRPVLHHQRQRPAAERRRLRNIVVAYKNGAPVHLSDVATVVQGAENNKLSSWANKTPAVLLNVQRQPGANVIAVVDPIKEMLPQIEAGLPASVDVTVLTDRTNTIRASVADVEFELMPGRGAGGAGDLRLPAQPARHLHSQPVGAAVHRRHLRGDVSAGLFAQQSVADGADHLRRLRGR